ncbi:MAG TPA: stalk domain-containing protein [Clostridia bacterium]
MLLSETNKKFDITWDANTKTIKMTMGINYTPIGGELTLSDNLKKYKYSSSKSNVVLNDRKVDLTAYTINNYSYFKLRDVAEAIDLGVSWDEKTNSININTNNEYDQQ